MNFLFIIFYLLLLDSLIALVISWTKYRNYFNQFLFFKRFMPLTKGWTLWYLFLVLLIGYILFLK